MPDFIEKYSGFLTHTSHIFLLKWQLKVILPSLCKCTWLALTGFIIVFILLFLTCHLIVNRYDKESYWFACLRLHMNSCNQDLIKVCVHLYKMTVTNLNCVKSLLVNWSLHTYIYYIYTYVCIYRHTLIHQFLPILLYSLL